jgi:hypothetical protein
VGQLHGSSVADVSWLKTPPPNLAGILPVNVRFSCSFIVVGAGEGLE